MFYLFYFVRDIFFFVLLLHLQNTPWAKKRALAVLDTCLRWDRRQISDMLTSRITNIKRWHHQAHLKFRWSLLFVFVLFFYNCCPIFFASKHTWGEEKNEGIDFFLMLKWGEKMTKFGDLKKKKNVIVWFLLVSCLKWETPMSMTMTSSNATRELLSGQNKRDKRRTRGTI